MLSVLTYASNAWTISLMLHVPILNYCGPGMMTFSSDFINM